MSDRDWEPLTCAEWVLGIGGALVIGSLVGWIIAAFLR